MIGAKTKAGNGKQVDYRSYILLEYKYTLLICLQWLRHWDKTKDGNGEQVDYRSYILLEYTYALLICLQWSSPIGVCRFLTPRYSFNKKKRV